MCRCHEIFTMCPPSPVHTACTQNLGAIESLLLCLELGTVLAQIIVDLRGRGVC